jgi:hypothetical protein
MAQQNDSQLIVSADVIKNETVANANTATRVGDMLNDIIDSKINNDKIDVDGTLTADSDDLVASQKAIKAYVDSAKSTDDTLGGATPSDSLFPSQKAIKTYVDAKRPYAVYSALLNQTAGGDPIATVLQNELLPITWAYVSSGVYTATAIGQFESQKTFYIGGTTASYTSIAIERTDEDTLTIRTLVGDDELVDTIIEIRIYN